MVTHHGYVRPAILTKAKSASSGEGGCCMRSCGGSPRVPIPTKLDEARALLRRANK